MAKGRTEQKATFREADLSIVLLKVLHRPVEPGLESGTIVRLMGGLILRRPRKDPYGSRHLRAHLVLVLPFGNQSV